MKPLGVAPRGGVWHLSCRWPAPSAGGLTGVLLEINREGLTLVATDSYRLAVCELRATAEGEGRALVPERALDGWPDALPITGFDPAKHVIERRVRS